MHHRKGSPSVMAHETKANLDEQVGFFEFIRTSDKITESDLETSKKTSPAAKKLKEGQKKTSTGSIGSKEPPSERKMSGESITSSLIPKAALRMKAFKNCHKATFHSLDCPDSELNASSSSESTQSISSDLLQMPNFETLQLSVSKKTHSDPTLRKGSFVSRISKSAPSNSNKPITQRVLHTIEQKDGSVIGFCTEEPLHE
ncbi:hypothetical protein L596_027474 [Steinernema carpocapsae]|uniref:Uncharacterized protein n=1 Tax=Steinernema carpocapsae TaxID=34508 RepID=A0A4U5LVK7_STECR|nr:hypothetical protein L596_027474 [Steinernema carpocapsae]